MSPEHDCHGVARVWRLMRQWREKFGNYEKRVVGEVTSWTRIPGGPVIAWVEIENGKNRKTLTVRLTGLKGDPKIGMKVELAVGKLGEGGERGLVIYGFEFRPPIGRRER